MKTQKFFKQNLPLFCFLALVLVAFLSKKYTSSQTSDLDPYSIYVEGSEREKSWSDFEGQYPIIAVTDSEHFALTRELALKLQKHFFPLTKGIFLLDYSGQEQEFFATIQGEENCWSLKNFDGSIYALYPFTKIPAYYFIDEMQTAHGPFYQRKELVRQLVRYDKKSQKNA